MLDLALSEPEALGGTAAPWIQAGYTLTYRRFYPHLTRADLRQYRVLLLLGGRAPEAPSDALRPADLVQLGGWLDAGGVVVVGYAADGEGSLDRWTLNRWLEALGTGVAIEDEVLRDSAGPRRAGADPQPWVSPRRDGPVRSGAVAPFPGGRNHALRAPARAVLAHAAGEPVLAAVRVGEGLLVVASRHALGALGAELRTSTAPFLGGADVARARAFLVALARWTRRPAEWAHVPPARPAGSVDLRPAPRPLSTVPAAAAPPAGVATAELRGPEPGTRPPLPAWTRRGGFRVLRDDTPLRAGLLPSARARLLDSLVELMEAGALTALWTRAAQTPLVDTTRSPQWERDVLRAAWKQIGERLQATSVRWLPGVDLRDTRFPRDTVELDARGDTVAPWAGLDPAWWSEAVRPAVRVVARLAADLGELVPGIVVDAPAYGMGAGFADPTFRAGLAALPADSDLLALPPQARFDSLLERGRLAAFYTSLEAAVAQRAAALRQDLRRVAPGRGFGLRVREPSLDWFARGLLRGLGDSATAVWLLTDEARSVGLEGRAIPLLRLAPELVPTASWSRLGEIVFTHNGGFWLDLPPGAPVPDSLAPRVRRLVR